MQMKKKNVTASEITVSRAMFYEARRCPLTQSFPTKQQVSRFLASSKGGIPDISALDAQHTEQHSNV